jgi:hypothetical protein
VSRAKTRVCGGLFTPDPDLPADHQGRRTCRCGLTGEAGDAHHTPPEPADDVQRRAAGERTEGT